MFMRYSKCGNYSPQSEGLAAISKCKNSEQSFHKRVKNTNLIQLCKFKNKIKLKKK